MSSSTPPPPLAPPIVPHLAGGEGKGDRTKLKFTQDWDAMAESLKGQSSATVKALFRSSCQRDPNPNPNPNPDWTQLQTSGKGGKAKMKLCLRSEKLGVYLPNPLKTIHVPSVTSGARNSHAALKPIAEHESTPQTETEQKETKVRQQTGR